MAYFLGAYLGSLSCNCKFLVDINMLLVYRLTRNACLSRLPYWICLIPTRSFRVGVKRSVPPIAVGVRRMENPALNAAPAMSQYVLTAPAAQIAQLIMEKT